MMSAVEVSPVLEDNDVVEDIAEDEVLDAISDEETHVAEAKQQQLGWVNKWISGAHSRREWLLLGERIFSHPRYAVMIVAALVLSMFERHWFILAPLALFFTTEWVLRFWLQKENHFQNRVELFFLVLDGIATISLISVLFVPIQLLNQGMYLRIARLSRGMYMLRMLRIFRFLTHDTLIYSLPFSLVIVGVAMIGVAIESTAVYIGVLLLLEVVCRVGAVFKVLPEGGRRHAELGFVAVDTLASIALLGVIPGLSPMWAVLRICRFLIMLNPLGNIVMAAKRVASIQEVRRETSMLAGMLVAMMIVGALSVVYLYPQMDINDDGAITAADYAPFQVVLYVFRVMTDPGAATPEAFSPWLVGLTAFLVMSGVFFFALVVSLGSNVMQYMLRELSNSPLSAREYVVFAGYSPQAIPILKKMDKFFARMRQNFSSVWIFHQEPIAGASQVGSWLSVREVESGSRNLKQRFHLSGIKQLVLFREDHNKVGMDSLADAHHLARDLDVDGVVVAESSSGLDYASVYTNAMGMEVMNSASIAARMLYQMHHCAWMPELGVRMLDAVAGETGLYTKKWVFEARKVGGKTRISYYKNEQWLDVWLSHCFEYGVNLLAARREDGSFILFSDLMQCEHDEVFTDVVGLGIATASWKSILLQGLDLAGEPNTHNPLKQFVWPETWDLSMIFVGWHAGLPDMVEEMALKHHKLTVHVLSVSHEDALMKQSRLLKAARDRATKKTPCELKVSVQPWDVLDSEMLLSLLRGCKVMMFYPEAQACGGEDSLLELWFHEVARLLAERKANVKWWTPPKLMVLPRKAEHVPSFEQAAMQYPELEVNVGSPDSFHDVFMARRLLTHSCKHLDPYESGQQAKSYAFMDAMLGDVVLVEDVETTRLVEVDSCSDWVDVYRESLRRGWILMAYILPESSHNGKTAFTILSHLFPQPQDATTSRMHLLAGTPTMEMDVPAQTVSLLFCRRGVLNVDEEKTDKEVVDTAADISEEKSSAQDNEIQTSEVGTACEDKDGEDVVLEAENHALPDSEDESKDEVAVAVLEGEVMNDSVWPQQADKRLLRVLQKQVSGSLDLLGESSENGLIKLTEILDMGVSEEVEAKIMDALTDLQNIDRVSQRLTNVKSCLDDWANHAPEVGQAALWEEEVSQRYVMEEERMVLKEEL